MNDASDLVLDDRYAIGRRIGAGGAASVYEAIDRRLGKRVAVKVLSPAYWGDEVQLRRFAQEARNVARVHDEHLVDVTDFGVSREGIPYLVMELLDGRDLHEVLGALGGAIPWPRALAIAAQVCEGLAAAHAAGLVHRDIKPSNVFLIERRGQEFVKLLDLGIAKAVHDESGDPPLTNPAQGVPGTVQYMAPEQARGLTVSPATDLYALGVVLFRAITGRLPFVAPNDAVYSLLRMHCEDPPPLPSSLVAGLPAEVDALILRCLAKEPGDRWPSAATLGAAAAKILRDRPPEPVVAEATAPANPVQPPPTLPSQPPLPVAWRGPAIFGAGVLLLAGVVGVALVGDRAASPSPATPPRAGVEAALMAAEAPDPRSARAPRSRPEHRPGHAESTSSPAPAAVASDAASVGVGTGAATSGAAWTEGDGAGVADPALPSPPRPRPRRPREAEPVPVVERPDPSLMRELEVLRFRLRRCPSDDGRWPLLRVDLRVEARTGFVSEVVARNMPPDSPFAACVAETLGAQALAGVAAGVYTDVPIELDEGLEADGRP